MNPLLFADWTRIHRLFRGLMWILAIGLALAVFAGASLHAATASKRSQAPPRAALWRAMNTH
jgi:hypothetical protein